MYLINYISIYFVNHFSLFSVYYDALKNDHGFIIIFIISSYF